MQDSNWSHKEKQVARAVFEQAAVGEEQELVASFKARAASVQNMADLLMLQLAIRDAEREYQQKYDFRYSQLILVFGRLVHEGRVKMEALRGLSEEKLKQIERIALL